VPAGAPEPTLPPTTVTPAPELAPDTTPQPPPFEPVGDNPATTEPLPDSR
jgi:hypothetical protein